MEEKELWEEFGISQEKWEEVEKHVQHKEIDSAYDEVEFAKLLFPDSVQNQVLACLMAMSVGEWDYDEDAEEDSYETAE